MKKYLFTFLFVGALILIGALPAKANAYTISATSGANGAISPSGTITVNSGATQAYTITPSAGYVVSDVVIDGNSQGSIGGYTFANITSDHTISASFTLTVLSCPVYGWSQKANFLGLGRDAATGFSIGNDGYIGTGIKANPNQGGTNDFWKYNSTTNTWTQKANVGGALGRAYASAFSINGYGYITLGESMTLQGGIVQLGQTHDLWRYDPTANSWMQKANFPGRARKGAASFAIGNYGYIGAGAGLGGSIFSILNHTITTSAGANGTISPSGSNIVNDGSNFTYTITPNPGYAISAVVIDGVVSTPSNSAGIPITISNVHGSHTVSASFTQPTINWGANPITVTAATPANGVISPAGVTPVANGASQTYTFTPNSGYHLANILLDGSPIGALSSLTLTNVTFSHTISAVFNSNATNYTITASAGPNGSISQPGIMNVTYVNGWTFSFTPNNGYAIADVIVNGVSKGPLTSYTFSNVTRNSTIKVLFSVPSDLWRYDPSTNTWAQKSPVPGGLRYWASSFVIGGYGYVGLGMSSNNNVNFNDLYQYNPTTDAWTQKADMPPLPQPYGGVPWGRARANSFAIDYGSIHKGYVGSGTITPPVNVNGAYPPNDLYSYDPSTNSWTAESSGGIGLFGTTSFSIGGMAFSGVGPNIGLTGTSNQFYSFCPNPGHTITATAGANGAINPPGAVTVPQGGSRSYTITPNFGFNIATLTVDGVSITPQSNYTFTNVTTNRTIAATFVPNGTNITITASAGANGTITPSGTTTFVSGNSQTYYFTPNNGYYVASILVDGVAQPVQPSYTFSNITVSHTISVTFTQSSYTITASAGPNGTISPSGVTAMGSGGSQTYLITPNNGYIISSVLVDGVPVTNTYGTYTFSNITANRTIAVTFGLNTVGCSTSGGEWTRQSNFAGPSRVNAAGFSIGTDVYIGTGNANNNGSISQINDLWKYDQNTDTWTQKANFAGGNRLGAIGFSVGNYGYMGTGSQISHDFWRYDPVTNTWAQKASVGTSNLTYAVAFSIGNYGYVGTGFVPGGSTKNFWQYNPATDSWAQKADVGGINAPARYKAAGFSVGGYGFLGTGYSSQNPHGLQDFYRYDPTFNSWQTLSNFGGGTRWGAIGFSLGTKGFIGTGTTDGSYPKNDFWQYNPATYQWTQQTSYPVRVEGAVGVATAGYGYIGTGNADIYGQFQNTFYKYCQVSPQTYTITASAGIGGTISPAGITSVNAGAGLVYTITPNSGYTASNVFVDGVPVGIISSYTFPAVFANHTISATFVPSSSCIVTATTGSNGTISPAGMSSVPCGTSPQFTLTPNSGYHVSQLTVDGSNVTTLTSPYTFTNITSGNHTIDVQFAVNTTNCTINGGAGSNGTISPNGLTTVNCGTNSTTYTFTPNNGYHIQDVTVNSVPQGPIPSYTFTNITSNKTIFVTFAINVNNCIITPSAGANGTISPSSPVTTNCGTNSTTFTFTANNGYHIHDVSVNGVSQGALNTYTFSNITANSTISVVFAANSLSCGTSNTWTQKANFGTIGSTRAHAVGFSIGSDGYMGTGSGSSGPTNDFWKYDQTGNSWTQKANLAGPARYAASGFSIGSYGYIGAGQDSANNDLNDFYKYDPAGNTWTTLANFGGAVRYGATGFSIGTKGYMGTGYNTSSNSVSNDFWQFDPAGNTWTQKANFGGSARFNSASFSIGNYGYIGAGDGNSDFWQYDSVGNNWVQKANFSGSQSYPVGFSIGNYGYFGTGFNTTSSLISNDFWQFDPAGNTWTQKANFAGPARYAASGFSIGTQGYIGTGLDNNYTLVQDFWSYCQ